MLNIEQPPELNLFGLWKLNSSIYYNEILQIGLIISSSQPFKMWDVMNQINYKAMGRP